MKLKRNFILFLTSLLILISSLAVCFLQEQFGENCRIKWRILHLQNGESCKQSPDWDDQSGNCRHNINFIYAM